MPASPVTDKTGVLLAQTGSPDDTSPASVRRYLRQFLSDPRVIELPRLLWLPILHLFVLTTRPARSAERYRQIWGPDGSPLIVIVRQLASLLQQRLPETQVEIGMRIGNPSLESGLEKLIESGCNRIILFPLFPQYAGATTGSICEAVFSYLGRKRFVPALTVVPPFFGDQAYIEAQAQQINHALGALKEPPERLLLSYHGLPKRYVELGDPYAEMCDATTAKLLPLIKFDRGRVLQTYQSRFGRAEWLKPYTESTIINLAREGVKNIAVACPSFVADCLETLDEIGNEAREVFVKHGGEKFSLLPCLNTDVRWADAAASIIERHLPGSAGVPARHQ